MVGTDTEESGGAGALWDVGSAREEAERFVAAALATASVAARELGKGVHSAGGSYATGSAECCVCPVCRVITALRDPQPEFVERLATGAGDLAAGVASLLRSLGGPGTSAGGDSGTSSGEAVRRFWAASAEESASAWQAATRNQDDAWVSPPPPPAPEPMPDDGWPEADDAGFASADPWAAATRAARPPTRPSAPGSGAPAAPRKPMAKKPAHHTPEHEQKKMAKKAVKPAVRPPAGANGTEAGAVGSAGSADSVDPIDSVSESTATHHAPEHEQKHATHHAPEYEQEHDAGGSGPQDASGPGNDA